MLLLGILFQGQTTTLPPGFTEKVIAPDGFSTGLCLLPDERLLILDKNGRIRMYKNGTLLSTPTLTLSNVDVTSERGLQSAVADPSFATNHFIYLFYTRKDPVTNTFRNRVSRFTLTGDIAVDETIVFETDLLNAGNHNGGTVLFGLDGKLYISTGENAVPSNAQSLDNVLGKILRINADGSIPTDNPFFATAAGKNKAIYALGFRNPFKMYLNKTSGKIIINDVGQDSWEELNELKAGKNYGWPIVEGKRTTQTPPANYEDPLYAYSHAVDNSCSLTGGGFYQPTTQQFPSVYKDKYFFQDYCGGYIKYLDLAVANPTVTTFASGISFPTDLIVDNAGNLYYIGLRIYQVTYTGSGEVKISVPPTNITANEGSNATFSVSATGTAPLQYQWRKNGVDIAGATSANYTVSDVSLALNGSVYTVQVSNSVSSVVSVGATLTVLANKAPVPTLLTPTATYLYTAGTDLAFSGSATDAEDGNLPASALQWEIVFHHNTHTHPAMPITSGINAGVYRIANEGEISDNVWYRVYLTATDSKGSSTTVFKDVYPNKVLLTLQTVPAGLPLSIDGGTVTTPYTIGSVVGMKRAIGAPASVLLHDSLFTFSAWSDNGAATHSAETPATNTTYTAYYTYASNTPPTVSLSSPLNNTTFDAPATVNIAATASDANGTVSKVEFYRGTTKLGTDVTAPYTFVWSPVSAGTYQITAKVTDNQGASTVSAVATIVVAETTAEILGPNIGGNNMTLTYQLNGSLRANATSYAWSYTGQAQSVAPVGGAPYTALVSTGSNFQTGNLCVAVNYSVSPWSKTYCKSIGSNVSTNTPPTVALTSPLGNTTYDAPATVHIAATASDVNGTIAQVEFYRGTTKLGTDVTAPYTFVWTPVSAGTYVITAKATDNQGASTISSAVTIVVAATTADIWGANCGGNNINLTFQLNNSLRTNATSYAWQYSGKALSFAPVGGAAYMAQMSTGASFLGGDVCVTVNYSVSPSSRTYCKTIAQCVQSRIESSFAPTSESTTLISPNPSHHTFTLHSTADVKECVVRTLLGETLEVLQSPSMTTEIGAHYPSGLYLVQIHYLDGRSESFKIQKQ